MAVSYRPKVVSDSLRLVMDAANPKCYPGSGNTCIDLTRNGNNGTFANGVSYSSTNNGVFVFDETTGQSIDCGSNISLNMFPLTISAWIYLTGYSATRSTIISRSFSLLVNGYNFFVDNSTRTKAIVYNHDGSTAVENTVDLNVWSNFVVSHSGSATLGSTATLYKNGEFIGSGSYGGDNIFTQLGTSTFYIGNNFLGTGTFKGNIAYVSAYSRALTATEVRDNFNALRGRFGI